LEQGIEVAAVLDEAVLTSASVGQLFGVAHADQVGGNASAPWLQGRQNVAPEVRRGGVAGGEHHWDALSHLDVRHLAAEHSPPLLLVGKCRGDSIHLETTLSARLRSIPLAARKSFIAAAISSTCVSIAK